VKAFVGPVAVVAAVVLQTILGGMWPNLCRFFDLPLIPVLYYAVARGPRGAVVAGITAGLLQDSLEATLLGLNALSKALAGYLVGVLGLRFALVPLVLRVLVIAAATIVSSSTEVATLAIMGKRLSFIPDPHLIQTVIGNCILGILLLSAPRKGTAR
jgi:rod shape-determining protein MreD